MVSTFQLRRAVRVLQVGGLVACPTEAVYGLHCDPLDPGAVWHLLRIKGRSLRQGFILVAADAAMLTPWLAPLSPAARRRLAAAWPGPVTFVCPAAPWVPAWLRGAHPGLAVRVTAHPVLGALSRGFGGPLVSTSANPSGRPPARTPLGVRRYFDARVDVILHGPLGGADRPTEIRDVRDGRVLRR
ncbi:MAG: Sua5/YciO/YrdC/YwlC family protein [Gammaproteobacteria bacterium]|nr:MAG: Sua5/YciO/YrdC/YwlC family protein [Gammaproteobacteria bacterium]